MPATSSQWERTRQHQLNLVRLGIFLLIALGLALVVIVQWPVRRALERQACSRFEASARLATTTTRGFFDQAVQLALQLPSRTQLRVELVKLLHGTRSREWYVEYGEPRLLDAVEASPEILGAMRTDPDGEALLCACLVPEDSPDVRPELESPTFIGFTRYEDGPTGVFVQVPIHHQGHGLAGFDIVHVSMAPLIESLNAFAHSSEAELVELSFVEDSGPDGVALEVGSINDAEAATLEITKSIGDQWILRIASPESVAFREVHNEANFLLISVAVVATLAVVLGSWMMLMLSRRTLAETGELDRIVGEQTIELRTLLSEIHHRVKNDIALMTSFLGLKAEAAHSDETSTTLAEASASLRVMGEVYDVLRGSGEYASVNIRSVLTSLFAQMKGRSAGSRLEIESHIADVSLPRKAAIPVGIIVHELVTNSIKYGATPDGGVVCRVTLEPIDDSSIRLSVSDSGAGFTNEVLNGSYGFGLTMIAELSKQLRGTMTLSNEPEATVIITASIEADDA